MPPCISLNRKSFENSCSNTEDSCRIWLSSTAVTRHEEEKWDRRRMRGLLQWLTFYETYCVQQHDARQVLSLLLSAQPHLPFWWWEQKGELQPKSETVRRRNGENACWRSNGNAMKKDITYWPTGRLPHGDKFICHQINNSLSHSQQSCSRIHAKTQRSRPKFNLT